MAPSSKPAGEEASARRRAYFTAQPPAARRGLEALRAAIHAAVPEATEVFSYGVPGFRLQGKPLAWYAAWKTHWSLYPITPAMRRAGGAALERLPTSKGTVHFSLAKVPPLSLVRRMVKARAAEIGGASGGGAARRSPRATTRARSQPAQKPASHKTVSRPAGRAERRGSR